MVFILAQEEYHKKEILLISVKENMQKKEDLNEKTKESWATLDEE